MAPKLPVRCECGWILPAAFQLIVPGFAVGDFVVAEGTTLLVACGNCGVWLSCAMTTRAAACTENAAGFAGMPEIREEPVRAAKPRKGKGGFDAER